MAGIEKEINSQATKEEKIFLSTKYLVLYVLVFSSSLGFNELVKKILNIFPDKMRIWIDMVYVILIFVATVLFSVVVFK